MALTLAEANRILQAAITKAQEMNIKVSAAVCDAGGRLVAFNRMDGAIWGSVYGSQGKAIASVAFGRASRQFFAPATERMLDLATIPVGGRVLDAATMLDQAAMIARRQGLSNVAARAVRRVPSGRTQRDARRVGRRGLAKCRHP